MNERIDGNSAMKQPVEHPSHYNVYDVEVLDMMASIWGNEAVALWCKMTAFKYRMRMGYKQGVDIDTDFKKEQECLKLMRVYQERAANRNGTVPSGKLFETKNTEAKAEKENPWEYNPY